MTAGRARALVLAMVVSSACGGNDKESSPAIDSIAAQTPAADSNPGPPCALVGQWQPCSVEDRLERAGLVFKARADSVRHDFLSVPGVAYEVGPGELQVFIYANAAARERDSSKLDSATVSPPGSPIQWPNQATLIVSNNLLAILLSKNETQIERIELAITAGLPEK